MAAPTKTCPECGTVNFNMVQVCKGEGCGHVFFKKRNPRRKADAEAAPAADEPGFQAGLTQEGALLVFWYGRGEFTKFTAEETSLIRQVFNPLPPPVRMAWMPRYPGEFAPPDDTNGPAAPKE